MATEVAPPQQQMLPAHGCSYTDDNDTFSCDDLPTLDVPVSFAGQTHVFHLPAEAVLDDLTIACEDLWGGKKEEEGEKGKKEGYGASSVYDWSSHKFIGPPPVGLLKGAEDHDRPLAPLFGGQRAGAAVGRKAATLRLIAPRASAVQALRAAEASVRRREARRQEQRRHAVRARTTGRGPTSSSGSSSSSSSYTFQELRPLAHLPHADRSLAFLQRLRDDVGVGAAMRAHRFTVGLLTEMDPRQHTTASHEGTTRTLGLNRNQGQVIELRLRTDAGDGYRDYRTVRRTLCHELAHNVHGPHDASFWALCRQIEREVERADYHGSGRTLAGDDVGGLAAYQRPIRNDAGDGDDGDDEHTDAGGWTGGSFVLGSGAAPAAMVPSPATPATPATGTIPSLARRDLAARAAEDRLRRMAEQRRHGSGSGDGNGSGSSTSGSSGTKSNR